MMIRKVLHEFEMKFPWYIDTKAFNSICKAYSLGLLLGCSCIFLSLHVNSFQLSSNFRQVSFIGSRSRSTQNPLGRERISDGECEELITFASGSLGISADAVAVAVGLNFGVACMSRGLLDITSPLGEGLLLYLLMTSDCLRKSLSWKLVKFVI